jgi:SynChlorMet cassette radical SAM/SPASM protein ScmF
MIYFYMTDGCNLRCRHCWISPQYQGDNGSSCHYLPVDKFRQIIIEAKLLGLSGCKLTGGEPMMHPNIREILAIIKEQDLNLSIETNAVLCTPELAKLIASCKRPSVGVSLDGADAETHEWVRLVDGCFDKAIEGIKNLVEAGVRPQIVMSIMRRNKDQMEAVVRLAEKMGACSVKFNIIQPTERGEIMHARNETLSVPELIDIGRWVNTELAASTKMRIVFSQPVAFQPLGKIFGNTGDCSICGIKGIIGVLPSGAYALCGIGEKIPELTFGSVDTDRLEDIWNKTTVLRQLREGLPNRLEGVCITCSMKKICLGNCIAQNYYRCKNLWAPYWYCEQAEKVGAFPESRRIPSARIEND